MVYVLSLTFSDDGLSWVVILPTEVVFVQRCSRIWTIVSTDNIQFWTVTGEASVDEMIY